MARKKKEKTLDAELEAVGFTKPFSAAKLMELAQGADKKLALDAIKTRHRISGELRDDKGNTTLITNGQTMVIIGASKERIRALREGPVSEQPKQLNG